MKLQAPKGCGGVSFEGKFYAAEKGAVDVPDHAGVFLEPGWGFTLDGKQPAPEEVQEGALAAEAAPAGKGKK